MRRVAARLVWLLSLSGCGLSPVELAPGAPDDILVQGDVPTHALARFSSDSSGRVDEKRLSLRYPSEAAQLPDDFPPLTFAWATEKQAAPKPAPKESPAPAPAFFELCLRSVHRALCLYTPEREVAVPPDTWQALVRDSAEVPLRVALRGLLGTDLYAASDIELSFVPDVAPSAIYYRTAKAAELARARLSEPDSVGLVEVSAEPRTRGALHAVSRDGRRMVYAATESELALVDLPELTALWQVKMPVAGRGAVSLAFDPTARRIACARGGSLALLDADTGAVLTDDAFAKDVRVGHPDWSPDGRFIAVTLWPAKAGADEQGLEGSSLARLAVGLDGSLASPEVLVPSSKDDDTLAFAAYSPDGAWLAFERMKGKLKDAREARLWLVSASGGEALELGRAQPRDPKPESGTQHQPRWFSLGHPADAWLAFSSSRPVGNHALTKDQRQLWITPIDLALAGRGIDPSGLALWLPFQALDASNEHAVFAPDLD
jgi:hypothetical protein